MVTQAPSVPYGHVMRAALSPDRMIKGYQAEKYGKHVTLLINEFTNAIEGLEVKDIDLIFPEGTIAERDWRATVARNTRLERNRKLFDAYGTPVVNSLINAGATLLDIITLGAIGFSGDRYKELRTKAASEIANAYGYKLFDARRQFYFMGVPRYTQTKGPGIAPPATTPKEPFISGGSLPLGFDDDVMRDRTLGTRSRRDYLNHQTGRLASTYV